jgi:hypothetical protein
MGLQTTAWVWISEEKIYHCLIYANSRLAYREYNFYTPCRIAHALRCVCIRVRVFMCVLYVARASVRDKKRYRNSKKCVTLGKGNDCLESKLCDYGTQTSTDFFQQATENEEPKTILGGSTKRVKLEFCPLDN